MGRKKQNENVALHTLCVCKEFENYVSNVFERSFLLSSYLLTYLLTYLTYYLLLLLLTLNTIQVEHISCIWSKSREHLLQVGGMGV